jgi:branched-chain amino acid transport system substrate-binding protein
VGLGRYPMDKFIGVWWSGSEVDVRPAGDDAIGYKAGNFHGIGTDFPVVQDILTNLYAKGDGTGSDEQVGEVLYNRGLINMFIITEAIRTAMGKYGDKPLTGEQVRWGFENLNIDQATLDRSGFAGMMKPIKLSCTDHEGGGQLLIQQWDGSAWEVASDWITPDTDLIRGLYEQSAEQYAAEKGISLDRCTS